MYIVTTLYINLTLFYIGNSDKSVGFPTDESQTRYQSQEILLSIDSDALQWSQPNLRYDMEYRGRSTILESILVPTRRITKLTRTIGKAHGPVTGVFASKNRGGTELCICHP